MSVESFSADQVVAVTDAAAEHFARELSNKPEQGVRLSLKESGCTGFKYVIDEVVEGEEGDLTITLENGVKVFVDSQHLSALTGIVIDYVKEGLNRTLVMNNPNVKDKCGCGESFNV